jgi:hypothetical protein
MGSRSRALAARFRGLVVIGRSLPDRDGVPTPALREGIERLARLDAPE